VSRGNSDFTIVVAEIRTKMNGGGLCESVKATA